MRMSFTDHHLQDKIIFDLINGKSRFSELVPSDMEHSLFMYHMKKLMKAGVVAKDGQVYSLTETGAKLYNARYRLSKPLRQPSLLIQFLVMQDDRLLLSQRTTSLKNNLNEYMLPGGAHTFLLSSRANALQIAKARGLKLGDFFCTVETISKQRSFHGVIDVYFAQLDHEIKTNDGHELVWLPFNEVQVMDFALAGSAPFILSAFEANNVQPRLTNRVD